MEIIDDSGAVKPIPSTAKKVFHGKIFSVWQWEQGLYDGTTATYEALKRPDTAHIVGVLPDKKILITEDTQPNRGPVLTPPGGQVDPGETPQAAATRELLEETGYEAEEVIPWHQYQAHAKIEWFVHAFIGRGLKKVAEPQLEAGEKVKVKTLTFDEFLQLGRTPHFRDRIIRTILLEALLDKDKQSKLKKLLYAQ